MFKAVVIGGGPAGLAAAISAKKHSGARVLVIEREDRTGGVLKQCIHDGFGLLRFNEKLSGPEYAERYIELADSEGVEVAPSTFVTNVTGHAGAFRTSAVSPAGVSVFEAETIILATGCRERTAKQVNIHGTFPAGVLTAGTAQYLMNIMGQSVGTNAVILGSGDIGMIMARRLKLEGADVAGVYEIKSTVSGLMRNVRQCLSDYDIPLCLSETVTRIAGKSRVEGVYVQRVREDLSLIEGTERFIPCDTLILSVGLIPENEVAESLGVMISRATKGPVVDQNYMTSVPGVFCCGNALFVNDLVDYVSEGAERAGISAANFSYNKRDLTLVTAGSEFLYAVPQLIDLSSDSSAVIYFRPSKNMSNVLLTVTENGETLLKKRYIALRPAEMERIEVSAKGGIKLSMEEVEKD